MQKESIPAERLTIRSSISYATAESRLRSSIQKSKESVWFKDQESFEAWTNAQVGPHGFMYFNEYNHGSWLPFFEPPTSSISVDGTRKNLKCNRFILGNPLIAITMLKHDLNAGLCVPVELYLVDEADGGVRIVWYKPATLIAGYDGAKKELVDAAEVLSSRLETFIRWVLREEDEQNL